MPTKRKFSDYLDSVDEKQRTQRLLYASKIQICSYHEIFSHIPVSTPTQNVSTCDQKLPALLLKDLYRPLAPFQIRVLHIEAGTFEEPLNISLSTVDLLLEGGVIDPMTRKHCTYEAVSHSWSDDPIGGILPCNSKSVNLRESQHMMLKHLRNKTERRCVWLDTICINQDDIAERAAQVGKMFTIFKHAKHLLIWLGLPKPRTSSVFKALTKMKATGLLHFLRASEFSRYWPPAQTSFVPNMCSGCHTEFALGIEEFSAFPWFRRTWVRQEVFASEAATILCGPLEYPWSDFGSYICVVANGLITSSNSACVVLLAKQIQLLNICNGKVHLNDEDIKTGSLSFVYQLFDQQVTLNPSDDADLFRVLANSASFKSSDPRDIIYGVLGMSNAQLSDSREGRPSLKIDYSLTAAQVFCQATEYFIRREKCFDAMFLAQFYRDLLGKTASWCPYWPMMNCEFDKLRRLCQVNLLDRHSSHVSAAFDGTSWPRVIAAEVIDVQSSVQPDNFCSFQNGRLQVEGHALGMIKIQKEAHKKCKFIFKVFDEHMPQPSMTDIDTSEVLDKSCSEYTPLHIEHALAQLSSFIKRIDDETGDETAMWPEEEIDRLCLACVPAITRDGDLFCFLRASSAFVVLRPLKMESDNCCVRFVGIAFASQGIFDWSKLTRVDANDWAIDPNRTHHQEQTDIKAFNRIIQQALDDEIDEAPSKSSHHLSLPRTPSLPISDGWGGEVYTSGSETRTPTYNPMMSNFHIEPGNRPQHMKKSFQRHFDGPIRSLKLTFDIT